MKDKPTQGTLFEGGKPAVLVSRCAFGVPCRFHGKLYQMGHRIGHPNFMDELAKRYQLIDICPECDAGLPIPRPPARIVEGRVVSAGADVTAEFERGAAIALERAKQHGCKKAYLVSDSPACGKGYGVAANLLEANGVKVVKL